MINFASLFNQFRMSNSSIGDLLDSPATTIDRLLDEDSFVNQYKSGNSKVQQFMKYDKYETLVKYVTEVGPADDRKRSYKYPLTACQLLSSDNSQIIDFFFGQNPIIIREEVPNSPQTVKSNSNADAEKQTPQKEQNKQKEEQKMDQEPTQKKQQKSENNQVNLQAESNTSSQHMQQEKPQNEDSNEQATPQVKTIQKQMQPLRNGLFLYFKGDVNYTLAGYVSKIFSAFLTKKPLQVNSFLLETQRFKQILNHIQSRSVGELVVKMLTQESTDLLEERKKAFQQMLDKVSKDNQVYVISNLATAICQTIQKVALSVKNGNQPSIEISKLYFTPEIVTKIISNVMSDQENVSVYNAQILQTYLTNVPLVIPEKSQLTEDLKNLLQSFLKKTLEKLSIKRQTRSSLGFGRMKIIQILSFVLRQNILSSRELAASQPTFFPTLFNLCTQYQYNNVLHNEVVKIVEIALNQTENSPFLQSLLNQDVLLKFLIKEAEEDQKIRAGSGSQKCRKGYIGHIVSICRKIKELSQSNPGLAKFSQTKQFEKIIENLVNKEVFEYNKTLAGYSMKRGNKHPILFQKKDIIQEHMKFLAATPAPVFELEPEHVNIEHPDLVQAERLQKEAEAQMEAQKAAQAREKMRAIQEQLQKEIQIFNPRFFEGHLQYNVDQLLLEL